MVENPKIPLNDPLVTVFDLNKNHPYRGGSGGQQVDIRRHHYHRQAKV